MTHTTGKQKFTIIDLGTSSLGDPDVTEQNVGPKPPTVRFEMEAVLAGARSTWSFLVALHANVALACSAQINAIGTYRISQSRDLMVAVTDVAVRMMTSEMVA